MAAIGSMGTSGQDAWRLSVSGARASGPEQDDGDRASLGIHHISKTCAVAAPHVTASHRHSSDRAAVLPVRETGQQWAMLKLFGAAATCGVVLR
jgi:hypothetical protein